ncbi:MAG: alanine racemase [Helicobacteraceae bacterium]|jgi:alanine racemase|nr:alanine racemase [Helicobacteraceae bacterium]
MSVILLSRGALRHNLNLIREAAGGADSFDAPRIAAVLKDNAYGHGLREMASLCAENDVRFAIVRFLSEAETIAEFFDEILILAENPNNFSRFRENFSFAINDFSAIAALPRGAKIHLKIDSGMHRNGVAIANLDRVIADVADRGAILRGVFSHLRSADVLSAELFWQEKNFEAARELVLRNCADRGIDRPLFHLHASAGIFRSDRVAKYDLIRPGIAIYGYADLQFPFFKPPLKPVLSLWADRLAARELRIGDRAGYGGVFEAALPIRAATYDVGYGDGFLRLNGSEGYKTASGETVLGRVSMDNMIIASDAPRVCVLYDAERLAKARGTISYEVLVRLNPLIERAIVD